ncbi:hypothetical protein [Duncaniella muris]|uniref:hypothetical protein n=1 Tax=Duncaniella muris TaxID=2094150 RepID=UPI003F6742B2
MTDQNLPNRTEILALIDSDMEPDAKEPASRSSILRTTASCCRPTTRLRHTDYRIEYNIRTYSDVNEIRRIMKEQPQKLSLNEFYLLAQDCQPGSEELTMSSRQPCACILRPRSQPQRSSLRPRTR